MSRVRNNLLYNISYQVLQILIPLITAPYISRVLGAELIGIYAYNASIGNYFVLFSMLGIANYGNRSIALISDHSSQERVFNEVYSIQMLTTTIALVFFTLFCFLCEPNNISILYTQYIVISSSYFDVNWLFWGLEDFKTTVLRNTVIKITTAISIFLLVKDRDDLLTYALIITVSILFSQLILWINARKAFKFRILCYNDIKKHIKPILVLFIPIIAYSIYKMMDKIMLGQMASMSDVGCYENAEKFINIPIGFVTAFGTVMMPRISALVASDDDIRISEYNDLSFKYFSIIIYAISFGYIGIGNVLAPVFYGEEFAYSGTIISILSISLLFITWANIIRTQYLIPKKNDRPYVISTVAGACVNLFINYLLIPPFGAVGAAIGTVFAEASVFITQMVLLKQNHKIFGKLKPTLRFLGYGVVMCIILRYIGNMCGISVITLIKQICTGIVLYIVLTLTDLILSDDPLVNSLIHRN